MALLTDKDLRDYQERGFLVVDNLIALDVVSELRQHAYKLAAPNQGRAGVRNVLEKSSHLRDFARHEPTSLARLFLGQSARPVKLTFFDKTPQANWRVPMHQDLTIAVKERREVPGFGPWSIKDGRPHVQPPPKVLASLVAIRLHLDDTPSSGGALRVIPASHRHGRLTSLRIGWLRDNTPTEICPVRAGGAMVMSPLLVHASSPAESPSHRRVLHFEFASCELPGGLEWG